jgi:prefoldin subunit 5
MAAETLNYSNIPVAPFAENVAALVKEGETAETSLENLKTLLGKYRMMEASLKNKLERFIGLQNELNSSYYAVEQLSKPNELGYDFELGDTLYAKATIPDGVRTVGLWLGAGIMVEYSLAEAKEFLNTKRDERKEEIRKTTHDLDYIRKQITTMEVVVARLFNYIIDRQKQ